MAAARGHIGRVVPWRATDLLDSDRTRARRIRTDLASVKLAVDVECNALHAVPNELNGHMLDVDSNPLPPKTLCDRNGCPATAERVQHDVAGIATGADHSLEERFWFLRRVPGALLSDGRDDAYLPRIGRGGTVRLDVVDIPEVRQLRPLRVDVFYARLAVPGGEACPLTFGAQRLEGRFRQILVAVERIERVQFTGARGIKKKDIVHPLKDARSVRPP